MRLAERLPFADEWRPCAAAAAICPDTQSSTHPQNIVMQCRSWLGIKWMAGYLGLYIKDGMGSKLLRYTLTILFRRVCCCDERWPFSGRVFKNLSHILRRRNHPTGTLQLWRTPGPSVFGPLQLLWLSSSSSSSQTLLKWPKQLKLLQEPLFWGDSD